jgi:hypothetical protein
MNKYALILLAFWMTLRPSWPLVEYLMNYDYIVNVLCENKDVPEMKCNGKCYLSKMLAKEQKKDQKNPFESSLVKTDEIPIIVIDITRFVFPEQESSITLDSNLWGFQNLISTLFVFDTVQPPEYLS